MWKIWGICLSPVVNLEVSFDKNLKKQNKIKQNKQTETHTNKQTTLTWSRNYSHRVKEESWKLVSGNNISFLPTCVHTSQLDELYVVIDVTKCLVNSKSKFVPGLFPSLELSYSLSSCGIWLKGRFMIIPIGHFRVHFSLYSNASRAKWEPFVMKNSFHSNWNWN